jgi:hypothetical protein
MFLVFSRGAVVDSVTGGVEKCGLYLKLTVSHSLKTARAVISVSILAHNGFNTRRRLPREAEIIPFDLSPERLTQLPLSLSLEIKSPEHETVLSNSRITGVVAPLFLHICTMCLDVGTHCLYFTQGQSTMQFLYED